MPPFELSVGAISFRLAGANRLYPKEEPIARKVVGQGGFEPPTSRLSSARSNQLSY
jgi:hypothetical protein